MPPSFLSMLRLKLRRHRRVELGNMRASQRAPASPILLSFARFFCVSICTAVLAKQVKQVTRASRARRRFSCPRDPRFASVFALLHWSSTCVCTSNTASKASKASKAMHLEIHALEGDTRTHRLSEHRHALNSLASVFVLLYW